MKNFVTCMSLLLTLSFVGCGGGDQGPADPSDIPPVDEAAIEQSIESGMPPEMKEKYGK